jgi:hypothetical protein
MKTITAQQRGEILNDIAEATGADVSKVEDRNAVRSVLVKILFETHGIALPVAFDIAWGEGAFEKTKAQAVDAILEEVGR